MPHKTRKNLFYLLIAAFFVLSAAVIAYAQGWRIDFSKWRLEKVGGIYVSASPSSAQIYLDGKLIKNWQSFFRTGTFINNLLPKNYSLKVSAENYQNWQETIAVESSLVTQIKDAVLIPEKTAAVFPQGVKNFWLAGENILVQNMSGQLILNGEKFSGNKFSGFDAGSGNILTKDENQNYFLTNLNNTSTVNLTALMEKNGFNISGANAVLQINPFNGEILAQFPLSIWSFNPKTDSSSLIEKSASTITAAIASPSDVIWTSYNSSQNISSVFAYNDDSQTIKTIAEGIGGKTLSLKTSGNGGIIGFLQNDGKFYVYRNGSPENIASDVKNFFFTADGSKVAALENSAVEIFSLDGTDNYWRFRLPDAINIKNLIWYRNNEYLFVQYPQNVYFLRLNDRSLGNFRKITDADNISYQPETDKLYFTQNGSLFRLDFPAGN